MPKLILALEDVNIMDHAKKNVLKGYIIQKKEIKPTENGEEDFIYANIEFHPLLFEH
jgi:hypothetical protein